ncbi:MAG: phosphoribosylamine--glycine ligase [Actinobacteria bacterium]|uniref:phosphoribosylamine--glycine ligase n=1 Tax=freshwater metagenome TaxID=449393 RepID=A0A6J6TLC9_9ZZZZ|nr:phosphoribosylamine--glycine ligase [Actinomycetota bacterium]MSY48943.1 phosphoribosylamine--glycine ligase [Actinomycetota bacterium]MTH91919.1 phosphoribosylamine--glycine ligase [Actinomycetota bacterium]
MRILLVGSGGREHALALGLHADSACTSLHVAPGNPGIAEFAECHPVDISNNAEIVALAQEISADLVVIGPEVPLVNGVADDLRRLKIAVFGPSKAAAQLEGSKTFAKEVMADAGVPTAHSFTCTTIGEYEKALDSFGAPYVVKDDGLAGGKGVVVTNDRQEALDHAIACKRVVIEEYLNGPEVSLFGISDGISILAMQPAQDFKRARDNDEGLNTGGMGAYSPLPWAPSDIIDDTYTQVLAPMIAEMNARGTPFVGLLYAGLALTDHGVRVIEFNVRFGDPETQVLIPLLKTPLASLLYKAATSGLADEVLEWKDDSAVTVVLAAEGYPSAPKSGGVISNLPIIDNVQIFHAGSSVTDQGLIASGGRVLTVTGIGSDLTEARDRAYRAISQISLPGSFYRSDIALNASVAEKGN